MTENNIPATEVNEAGVDERPHYEFAFHMLPTVAEEEVPQVFGELKTLIQNEGGEITTEEAPQRFDLAYDLVQSVEGRNRRYQQSYFGWVRFKLEREKLATLQEEIAHDTRLLRTMIVSLTKREASRPFRMFEAARTAPAAEASDEAAADPVEATGEEVTEEKAA